MLLSVIADCSRMRKNLQLEILFVRIIAVSLILVNWRILSLENLRIAYEYVSNVSNKLYRMLKLLHPNPYFISFVLVTQCKPCYWTYHEPLVCSVVQKKKNQGMKLDPCFHPTTLASWRSLKETIQRLY